MKWFDADSYVSLEIIRHRSISVHDVVKSVVLTDATAIKGLMDRIEEIPVDGDMMKSFGCNAESVDLVFRNATAVHTIEIYNQRFKTPSTGFNTTDRELESRIYADIDALLYPSFDKAVLKVKDLELRYDGFTVTYLGRESSGEQEVTASLNAEQFVITEKDKAGQTIQITSGQTPPAPFEFKVNSKSHLLLTYESKLSERLYPDYFQIIEK